VLGRLPITTVSSGFTITPVVGICHDLPPLCCNTEEVAALIRLPLRDALQISSYGHDVFERNGVVRPYRYLRYQEHYIWGATARILLSLAELLAKP
jgi:hypothetical protein